jgi:hypothetical protein
MTYKIMYHTPSHKCATPKRGLTFEEFKRGAKDMENENLHFQLQNDLIQHLAKIHLIRIPFQLKSFLNYNCLLMFMCLFKFPHITIHSHMHSCFFLSLMVLEHPKVPSNLVICVNGKKWKYEVDFPFHVFIIQINMPWSASL